MSSILLHVCMSTLCFFKGDIMLLVRLWKCHQVSCNSVTLLWHHTCPAKKPHTPMMQRMLKTADPTMVPTPTSPLVMNTPGERVSKHTHTHTHTHTHRALGLRREHRWCFVHYMTFQLQPSICSIDKQMSNNCQNICKWLSHGFPSLSHTHRPTYTCKSAHGKERQEENVSEEA